MTESVLSIMIVKDGHRMKLYEGNIGATVSGQGQSMWMRQLTGVRGAGVNENTPLLVMNKKNSGTMIIKSVEPALHWKKNYRWN